MQNNLIKECIENNCLLFGDFTLKSGKKSSFFFNATFDNGRLLYLIAEAYADHLYTILKADLSNYTLFGAAYKGIPLVSAIGSLLYSKHKIICNIVFNRKEKKDHGEGGNFVGKILCDKLIVIDDVLTKGTALHQVITMIKQEFPAVKIDRALILLDRMEVVKSTTAKEILVRETGIKIDSLICLKDIIQYLKDTNKDTNLLE
eukprot:NODE_89_length_21810_cov_0.170098.p12 type:complete len:203 gc:universal NODE_89_length_21810_cov_0.170098:16177-16785(+)